MHPFAGTPFAFWMTSMMCWTNMMASLQSAPRRKLG
jgi:hypothetical protein